MGRVVKFWAKIWWLGPSDSEIRFYSSDLAISDSIRRPILSSDRKVKMWSSESDCRRLKPHGAVFPHGAMQFSGVLPNRTAPYDFAFNKVGPNRTVGLSKLIIRVASHRTTLKKQIRTEPRSGLRIFKTKYFATVLWGYWCFLSDHTAPYDFPFDKTAPNRNIGFSKPKIRTDHTAWFCKNRKTAPWLVATPWKALGTSSVSVFPPAQVIQMFKLLPISHEASTPLIYTKYSPMRSPTVLVDARSCRHV